MSALASAIAAARRAAVDAHDIGKDGAGAMAYTAAAAKRDRAYRQVAGQLAALGRPHTDDDVHALMVAYARMMRGDMPGAAERFAAMIES